MRDASIALLRALTEAPGAPGHEHAVRDIFRRELDGLDVTTDALGSAICTCSSGHDRPRVMVTGHLDEVGFAVQHVTAEGFIRFVALGGWWSHTLPSQRVRVQTRDGRLVPGVVASTPPHLLSKEARGRLMELEELVVDVGAANRAEVESYGIRLGDAIVPDTAFARMENPARIMAKAFDNRVGIALTIEAVRQLRDRPHPNTVIGVATVQEELGARGAETAAAAVRPGVAVVLEGAPADDGPGFRRDEAQGRLGGGVQVRVLDPSAIMNRALTAFVLEVAESCAIPHQVAVRRSGGTDARAIQRSGTGVPVAVLGVPARYIHTHNSIIDMNDYESALRLTVELLQRLDEETVCGFTGLTV